MAKRGSFYRGGNALSREEPELSVDEEILVPPGEEGKRLDVYLARLLAEKFSRSQLQKLIREGAVRVNGHEVPPHHALKASEKIQIVCQERAPDETRAEDIPLEILYEDDDLIVVNKPAGMVVHPACGNPNHTLVNALLYHSKGLSQVGGAVRPGIVHRLDKDTSGIMVVAKNDRAHAELAKQFKNQTVERVYRVVVRGVVQHNEGVCEEPVGRAFLNRKKVIVKPAGGKEAVTLYRVLKRFQNATLLELRLQTGRTHQIRVHMRHMGHPVLGDLLYGVTSPWILRQCVHAWGLGFDHPTTHERMFFETSLPEDISKLLAHLGSE